MNRRALLASLVALVAAPFTPKRAGKLAWWFTDQLPARLTGRNVFIVCQRLHAGDLVADIVGGREWRCAGRRQASADSTVHR